MDEGLGVVQAKALLGSFADKVGALDKSVMKSACEFALTRLLNRTVSFEEQVSFKTSNFWLQLIFINNTQYYLSHDTSPSLD